MSEAKIILDACCGSRMFWFDKENPLVLFTDIRDEEHTLCDGRSLKVHPDIVSDFTNMPFLNESFKLVVFDPPHLLNVGKESWLAKKYGKLPEDWPRVIKKGIDERDKAYEDLRHIRNESFRRKQELNQMGYLLSKSIELAKQVDEEAYEVFLEYK